MVVIFYKVVTNTELMNRESLLLGEILSYVPEKLWTHFHQLADT